MMQRLCTTCDWNDDHRLCTLRVYPCDMAGRRFWTPKRTCKTCASDCGPLHVEACKRVGCSGWQPKPDTPDCSECEHDFKRKFEPIIITIGNKYDADILRFGRGTPGDIVGQIENQLEAQGIKP